MKRIIAAFVLGLIFALGLGLAGMTQPHRVVGFLDFTGSWDPSLAFVLASATGVYALLYPLVRRREAPLLEPLFQVPTRRDLTGSLVAGSLLFGAGWGLVGLCPAPAIASLATLELEAALFVATMLVGMFAQGVFERWRARPRQEAPLIVAKETA